MWNTTRFLEIVLVFEGVYLNVLFFVWVFVFFVLRGLFWIRMYIGLISFMFGYFISFMRYLGVFGVLYFSLRSQ